MSRAAIMSALRNDDQLQDLGLGPTTILSNYSFDQSPTRQGPFIILRWGADNTPRFDRGNHTRDFTLWAHVPSELGTDFSQLDDILTRTVDLLTGMEDVAGVDGYTVTTIKWHGSSADMRDPAFDTIARNAIFTVLSSPR